MRQIRIVKLIYDDGSYHYFLERKWLCFWWACSDFFKELYEARDNIKYHDGSTKKTVWPKRTIMT